MLGDGIGAGWFAVIRHDVGTMSGGQVAGDDEDGPLESARLLPC